MKVAPHVPALDGVRSFAIAGVLAIHAGFPGSQLGWIGVDLFFSLSGFLITTLLLNEWSKTGSVDLKNFWMRRFLRLMPAYYLYVAGITCALWLWPGSIISTHGGWSPLEFTFALWFYFINYAPMGGIWNGQILTVHLWSLAVEEQYYLFWPALLWLSIKVPRAICYIAWMLFGATLIYFTWLANDTERSDILMREVSRCFLPLQSL